MTHLRRLGFAQAAIFPCHTLTSGQVLVPALIEGEAATLLLATGTRLDVNLHNRYVEAHELAYDPRDEESGRASTGEFVALGRQREHAIANARDVARGWWNPDDSHAGEMGVLFFAHGVLAIDPAGPRVALTADPAIRDWPAAPAARVPLLADVRDGVPFTRAIGVPRLDAGEATFLLDTGSSASWLSADYVRRSPHAKRATEMLASLAKREKAYVTLALPGGREVVHRVWIDDDGDEDRFAMWDVDWCDGVLGMDFLRRWVVAFDVPAHELLLWDYASLADPASAPDAEALWAYVRGAPAPTAAAPRSSE
jgi:hypothetical protein